MAPAEIYAVIEIYAIIRDTVNTIYSKYDSGVKDVAVGMVIDQAGPDAPFIDKYKAELRGIHQAVCEIQKV